jgi:hypothetical protein
MQLNFCFSGTKQDSTIGGDGDGEGDGEGEGEGEGEGSTRLSRKSLLPVSLPLSSLPFRNNKINNTIKTANPRAKPIIHFLSKVEPVIYINF